MSEATADLEAARNHTVGAGLVDDPYPVLHELCQRGGVQLGTVADQFSAMDGIRLLAPRAAESFSIYNYETAQEVLRRPNDFLSEPFYAQVIDSIGPSVLTSDEPQHRRLRSLVQPAFSRREMERWKQQYIRPIVDEHFDRIVPLSHADIYEEIGATVPIHTISAALGLPVEDRQQFYDWSLQMLLTTSSPEERAAASDAVADYVAPLISERRLQAKDDLLSTLVRAEIPIDLSENADTRPLSDEEINSFVRIFILAGAGTTFKGYGSLMYHLLTHPDQLEEVRADRSLIPKAIDEALRIEQPLAFLGRVTSQPCVLEGRLIPEGSTVEISVSAVNHDPGFFPEPEHFDIHRDKVERHIAFGFGIHRCVGAHLAQAELSVMLERTLDRLPNLRLDPEATGVMMTGLNFRMVTKLPVLYDPSSS